MMTVRLVVVMTLLGMMTGCLQPGDVPDEQAGDAPDAAPVVDDESSFAGDVYPILQANCVNCHTGAGIAAFLPMNDGAQAVYDRLMGRPNVVNTGSPAASLILTKPLDETPANHPAAVFPDASDPEYVTILTWISDGAAP